MKYFKSKLFFLSGAMVLLAAALAPIAVQAVTCPQIIVECSGGRIKSCHGTSNGSGGCVYSQDCLSC